MYLALALTGMVACGGAQPSPMVPTMHQGIFDVAVDGAAPNPVWTLTDLGFEVGAIRDGSGPRLHCYLSPLFDDGTIETTCKTSCNDHDADRGAPEMPSGRLAVGESLEVVGQCGDVPGEFTVTWRGLADMGEIP